MKDKIIVKEKIIKTIKIYRWKVEHSFWTLSRLFSSIEVYNRTREQWLCPGKGRIGAMVSRLASRRLMKKHHQRLRGHAVAPTSVFLSTPILQASLLSLLANWTLNKETWSLCLGDPVMSSLLPSHPKRRSLKNKAFDQNTAPQFPWFSVVGMLLVTVLYTIL